MNEQQFAAIQNRWMAASGGPWTVDGPWRNADVVEIVTADQAVAAGICKTPDEWRLRLEDALSQRSITDWIGEGMERCRFAYAMPPQMVISLRDRVDRKGDLADEPSPTFFVLPSAAPADVEFLRHAAKDMGDLIHALEKAHEDIVSLRALTDEQRAKEKDLVARASAAESAVRAAKAAAKALLGLEP